jgi:hypothetical protein
MLKLHKNIKTEIWYMHCPHCYNLLNFCMSSPVYCIRCGEELFNYSKMMEDVEERTVYHILGETWELGAKINV